MKKRKGMLGVSAECLTCGKTFHSRNGVGLAAQHAKKYNHEVMAEVTYGYTFNPKD